MGVKLGEGEIHAIEDKFGGEAGRAVPEGKALLEGDGCWLDPVGGLEVELEAESRGLPSFHYYNRIRAFLLARVSPEAFNDYKNGIATIRLGHHLLAESGLPPAVLLSYSTHPSGHLLRTGRPQAAAQSPARPGPAPGNHHCSHADRNVPDFLYGPRGLSPAGVPEREQKRGEEDSEGLPILRELQKLREDGVTALQDLREVRGEV